MLIGYLTNTALELRADGTYTPFSADAWGYAGQMTLLGMLMVFAVLALLWGILAIFKLVFAGRTPKEKKPEPKETAPVQQAEAPAPAETQSDDEELVAVITAAVAAYVRDEGNPAADGGFRVVSFKRVREGRAWNSK